MATIDTPNSSVAYLRLVPVSYSICLLSVWLEKHVHVQERPRMSAPAAAVSIDSLFHPISSLWAPHLAAQWGAPIVKQSRAHALAGADPEALPLCDWVLPVSTHPDGGTGMIALTFMSCALMPSYGARYNLKKESTWLHCLIRGTESRAYSCS